MCGICGFVGPSDHQLLQRMTDALVHRGPDDLGFYEDDEISLGVRRLSIIDVAGGHQPMCNEDGSIWIAFNGEIFNHHQLREGAIERHHKFRTVSDTEVLVHLWEDYGEDMVRHLRGMFAFAVYDPHRRLLFLGRDHFGKKPLYYAVRDRAFWFASELRALFTVPEIARNLNFAAAEQYLTYFFNPLEESFIKGVFRLPPGCTLTCDISTLQSTRRQYWDPMTSPKLDLDDKSAMVVLEDRLTEAVKIRLESEVPMGVLLSGGVDSSVVTAVAAPLVENLQTFHVMFEGAPSEARFARMVAEETGAEHHELSVRTDPLSDFSEVAKWIDEPVADPSVFPTYYICREARRHVTVCLTGLGGDEVFRGYPWLEERSAIDLWFRIPRPMRNAFYPLAERTEGPLASISSDLRKYEELEYQSLDVRERCVARLEHFTPKSMDVSAEASTSKRGLSELMSRIKDDSDARDFLTVKSILPNDYLHKDDRLSMANSLELRSPLLDYIFAPLCLRFPSNLKSRRGISKYILKKFAVQILGLPRSAVYRKKVGFAIPLEGLHTDMLPELESLNSDLEFLPRRQLITLTRSRPSHENSGRVFAVLMLLRWCVDNDINMISRAG